MIEGDIEGNRAFGDLSGSLIGNITELCKLAVKLHSLYQIFTF